MIFTGILSYRGYRYLWWSLSLSTFALLLFASQYASDTARGNTWQGYTLGAIAGTGVLWLGYLGVRKRRYAAGGAPMLGWASAHVYLGLAVFLVATLHSVAHLSLTIHGMTYLLLTVVIVSGIVGVYLYLTCPRATADNRQGVSRAQLFAELLDLDRRARELARRCDPRVAAAVRSAVERTVIGGGALAQLTGADRSLFLDPDRPGPAGAPTLASNAEQRAITEFVSSRIPRGDKRAEVATLQQLLPVLFRRQAVLRRIRRDIQLQSFLEFWLYVHVPLSVGLIAALLTHVVSVFLYW